MLRSKRNRPSQKGIQPRLPRHGLEAELTMGIHLTPERIEEYMEEYRRQGYPEETVQGYQRKLKKLYEDLPEDKMIRRGTMDRWREQLIEEGYASSTVNGFLSASNTFLEYVGHREYQASEKLRVREEPQPELTRTEYLRILQAAKLQGKEKAYLLVKLFAITPMNVQELPKITVEAVEQGRIEVSPNGVKAVVSLPEYLRRELLNYAHREGRLVGPIFVTKDGSPLSRTYVSTMIRQLCPAARVSEEKGNPRCLKKLYQSTLATIEDNIALLVEQTLARQLEMEQMSVGWEEIS